MLELVYTNASSTNGHYNRIVRGLAQLVSELTEVAKGQHPLEAKRNMYLSLKIY